MSAIRTQIYLTADQRRRIDRRAATDGLPMAEVIRRAVESYLDDEVDPRAALAQTFGTQTDARVPSRDAWHRG